MVVMLLHDEWLYRWCSMMGMCGEIMKFRGRAEIHSRLGTQGGGAEAEEIDDRGLSTFISTSNILYRLFYYYGLGTSKLFPDGDIYLCP